MRTIPQKMLELREIIEKVLPQFATEVRSEGPGTIIIHQDAFAGDYQDSEYMLLGMAIKYVGMVSGKEIRIIGRNDETIKRK